MIRAPTLINKKPNTKNFYALNQDIMDIIFNKLSGKEGNQIKLMSVLIGTKSGFGISESWILERTGMSHASYIRARQALIEKGWLSLENKNIIINYSNIVGVT